MSLWRAVKIMRRHDTGARSRRGFTMAEMAVAAFLTSLLGLLIGTAVATFVRPVVEIDGRARLAVEARLATESLARDLGGYLPDGADEPGDLSQYRLKRADVVDNDLKLTYSGSGSDVEVVYTVQNKRLNRRKSEAGNDVDACVARYVTAFTASRIVTDDGREAVQITLSFTYPDAGEDASAFFSNTYQLIGVLPPL
jgi:hypothetical protein